jgi:structural maintenance of chromosome 3 (chondroitin sulfate proteoglycan 6)
LKYRLSNLAVQSQQSSKQLEDLIRRRTELECLIEDLDQANQDGTGRRERSEAELEVIGRRLEELELELNDIIAQFDASLGKERNLRQE